MIIVVTGPESCGKSTLCSALGAHLDMPVIDEPARAYMQSKSNYQPSDLLNLLDLQIAAEKKASQLILDTDLLTLIIWWREKYGPVPAAFQTAMKTQSPRQYLLCAPDIQWHPDPLRENPHDRERLFDVYQRELEGRKLPFNVIEGAGDSRLECALAALKV